MPTGTLGPTEETVTTVVQQVLAAQAGKRQLPFIEKIRDREDFPTWRNRLIRALKRQKLDKYILTDVPRPEDPIEEQQWLEERADVDDYIQAAVGDLKVWKRLEGLGWDAFDIDPKKTFDKLTQYFEDDTLNSQSKMMREFSNIRRDMFASMDAFQERINYLKNRLQANGSLFKLPDEAYILLTLDGIAHEYPDLHHRCIISLENKTLTWSILMRELQRIATSESANPALTTVQIDGKDDRTKANNNSTTPTNTGNKKAPYRGTCSICKKTISQKQKHCKGCDSHILKSVDECWWCDPEKAPDMWKHKEAARLKKAERQRSTTAPLYQQSGVANASTSKSPAENTANSDNSKSVLFTTSLLRLPTNMPSFQKGPQRK
ncbi:hypothetical protein P885DRAFT_27796 [Corynascus similis CBS 632.67]